MAPFTFAPVVQGIKDRVEAILCHGDHLYLGTSTGTLHIYSLSASPASLVESKKSFTRRSIEQLGYIKDINSLVTLSDSNVTLYPLPGLAPPTPLPATRGAMTFAINTAVQHIGSDGKSDPKGIPTVVTHLAVGCKRKVALYSWKDGESQGVKEISLPHTPRAVAFSTPTVLVFAYTATEHAIFSLESLSSHELELPSPPANNAPVGGNLGAVGLGMGMNALTGLGGYVGLGAKAKPTVVKIGDGEVLIPKESTGLFFDQDGKLSRPTPLDWPAPPDETSFIHPYVFATFPPGIVPSSSAAGAPIIPTSVVQIRSSLSLDVSQIVPLPPIPSSAPVPTQSTPSKLRASTTSTSSDAAPPPLHTLRLLTPSSSSKSPLFLASTPNDKAAATAEGTTLWMFSIQPWGTQIDELVDSEEYVQALALLESLDKAVLSDKDTRRAHIRALYAVSLFAKGDYEAAMNIFIELDTNPAKVIALYPESISGRLSVPRAGWIPLFGGKAPPVVEEIKPAEEPTDGEETDASSIAGEGKETASEPAVAETPTETITRPATPASTTRGAKSMINKLQASLDILKLGGATGLGGQSAKPSAAPNRPPPDEFKKSVNVLLGYYLNDRRPKINGALTALHISPSQTDKMAPLSETSTEELLALPDGIPLHHGPEAENSASPQATPKPTGAVPTAAAPAPSNSPIATLSLPKPNTPAPKAVVAPLSPRSERHVLTSGLTPEQLLRFAQMVDTALFKSYLANRPSLIGSLCRIENWCEVAEVEEMLRDHKKFTEMVFLYNGKKMHGKALALLKELSEDETDPDDKVDPTIRYLQKLGPEHLQTIFDNAKWVFETDPERAFQIFASEDVTLPSDRVTDYLETLDPNFAIKFCEHLIQEHQNDSPTFHDRLTELYLHEVLHLHRTGQEEQHKKLYTKLLEFMESSTLYSTDRLFSMLPSDQLLEARAILLGRLGKHEGALELYVHRLNDYAKAEDYCKRVYAKDPNPKGVFLTLLRIFLRPPPGASSKTSSHTLLGPALSLISRHSPRLDAVETLQLLPPLVTAADARKFLCEALKAPVRDTQIVREAWKGRTEQVNAKLMALQTRRVRVTDTRICPQCHKRLGNSVIAVHAPRGEVTHYQCRETFSKKLNETRL